MHAQMKDPKGLIVLVEALGDDLTDPPCGQDALIDAVRQCLGQPIITADQVHVAQLPVTGGGLGLPHLPTLPLVARASCLETLPRAAHAQQFREDLVTQEGPRLVERRHAVCPANGRPPCWIQSSDLACANVLATVPRARANDVGETPRGASNARRCWIHMAATELVAPKAGAPGDVTASETFLRSLLGKQASLHPLNSNAHS